MPLGNLISQFFANVYLSELDYFVKHFLKVKYYIRYVDDFVILHRSRRQLDIWKIAIDSFLRQELKLELHSQKSRIISLSKGIDFVGFRIFYRYKILRKRNLNSMLKKVDCFRNGEIGIRYFVEIYQGWSAYAKWADSYDLREKVKCKIIDLIWDKV